MRKVKKLNKNVKATSLDHAIELTEMYAEKKRKPSKVMCELMGVEYKTYRRWMIDGTMPLNKLMQLEHFAECQFISEYLCVFHGDKIVIDIPRGTKGKVTDLAELQAKMAEAVSHLAKFYQNKETADEAIMAINESLSSLAFQRENVQNYSTPELLLGVRDE